MGFRLAGEFLERDTLPHDARHGHTESFSIGELPVVVSIRLLVKVTEQVERLNTHVCAGNPSLQERPEVFQTVCMNAAIDVVDGLIDHSMLELVQSSL